MRVHNKNIVELLNKEKFIKSYLEKGDEIVAYQVGKMPLESDQFMLELKV